MLTARMPHNTPHLLTFELVPRTHEPATTTRHYERERNQKSRERRARGRLRPATALDESLYSKSPTY
jgi:hypothetical protein